MRHLNPTLYEVIYEWFHQLPTDYEAKKEGNTHNNLKNSQEAIIACLVEQFPRSYREAMKFIVIYLVKLIFFQFMMS